MKINLPKVEPKYVIGNKHLPAKPFGCVWLALVYGLYSKVYMLPLWADITAYGFILVLFAILCVAIGKQVEVNPFE